MWKQVRVGRGVGREGQLAISNIQWRIYRCVHFMYDECRVRESKGEFVSV